MKQQSYDGSHLSGAFDSDLQLTERGWRMAIIRVYRNEANGKRFPRLCMRCGEPTNHLVVQNFAWMPGWVHIFIFLGLAPWIIVALVTRKSMRVAAPMCEQHLGHWRVRQLYVWIGLLAWVAFATLLIVVWKHLSDEAKSPMMAILVFGFLIWLIGGLVLAQGAIKAAEIRERGIEIANVNKEFAYAWRDLNREHARNPREED